MIWQLAGVVGTDPGPLTLRELIWIAEAHRREAWGRTSAMMALLANCHRDPKRARPFVPSQFNPFEQEQRAERPMGIEILKAVFIDGRIPEGGRKDESDH